MTETTVNPKLGIAELEKVFEEYKNKLKLAEQESSEIINRAWRKAESIIAQEEEGRQNITKEIKRKATEEATNIILEAKNQAQQIIREADESVKKEAKERTRREVENILAATRQVAEKQAAQIAAKAKNEIEQIVNEIRETAKAEAHYESSRIITTAREKAKKADEDSIQRLDEINKFLAEVGQKAESVLENCKTQAQTTLTDLLLAIGKTKDALEVRNVMDDISGVGTTKATNNEQNNQYLKGHRVLKIIPPYDEIQRKRFLEFLQQLPSIRLAGKAGTEDGETIYINILEPLPLLSLLQEMSLIASFDVRGEIIKLKLKPTISDN